MRPPKNIWPNTTGGKSGLFIAQFLKEILTDKSFESFRALTLDTTSRINEAIDLLHDIQEHRIPAQALEPIWDELKWSLNCDPVIKIVAPAEREEIISRFPYKGALAEAHMHLTFLKKILVKTYKSELEKKIVSVFKLETNRIELRNCLNFYCSHVINIGYSKAYALQSIENHFFGRPIQRFKNSHLTGFFRYFNGKEKRFLVFAPVSSEMGKYLKDVVRGKVSSFTELPIFVKNAYASYQATQATDLFFQKEILAFDEFGAVQKMEQSLSSLHSLGFLAIRGISLRWHNEMFVSIRRSNNGALVKSPHLSFDSNSSEVTSSGSALKSVKTYSKKILSVFDPASTERLLSSIGTSALARTSTNLENKLISLWSAVEVLLSQPKKDDVRILHYVQLLSPCICRRHIRRQIIALFNELIISYRRKFTDILNKETSVGGSDPHTSLAAILLLKENAPLTEELCQLCANNPLALQRLWKFQKDFGDPQALYDAMTSHQKRVEWQLHRIYRARNNLVHAGKIPSYLDSLIMNAFEYYRSSIDTIVGKAGKETTRSSIDQVVGSVSV